jgi:hypothetical protein
MKNQLLPLLFLCLYFSTYAMDITIYAGKTGPAAFAASELEEVLIAKGHQVEWAELALTVTQKRGVRIILTDLSDAAIKDQMRRSKVQAAMELQPQGFSIRTSRNRRLTTHWVIGADAAGSMYGGLELAEMIQIGDLASVEKVDQNPYMAMRGTKFNIPLDVRTPSYTDVSDAAQHNIPEMWSMDFWKEYIDNLARYRYNYISLWNLHPFPSLVKVPEYPEVALDDVQRSTVKWEENYTLQGRGFDAPEILENVEVLKKMTIEDKIDFWREVMAYGKSRNVDFYFVTWNIFVYGAQGKHGITDNIDNPITIDYFRKSVKQMFLTYPDLKGIGLTTGENMPEASFEEKEDWAFNTYAQGVLDAAKEQPGRKITFIHRQHQAGALDIARRFKPVIDHPDIEFIFSYKYAKAHVYSSTTQTFHPGFVKDIQEEGNLKTIWTLRNDDIYYFRWGAPDFVREFIQNIPYDVSRGYYYGSDQYIWGREFMSKYPESPRQIEIVKHWYHWLLWGRLGYNPEISNERFTGILQARFPGIDARKLFTAWQEASMIYPKVTGFHWGSLDFQWYIEGCQSRLGPANTPDGFHDVNRFISLPPHPGTNNMSIPQYVERSLKGEKMDKTTPIQIANQLQRHTDRALMLLSEIDPGGNKELRKTLDDIRTIAYLGKYYAHKIQAATDLALFRKIPDQKPFLQSEAIQHLQMAAAYWRMYASMALSNYKNPLWTNRVGYVDWKENYRNVLYDLTSIGGPDRPIDSMHPTLGGHVLKAEDAKFSNAKVKTGIKGFTDGGYLEFQGQELKRWAEWTFEAPEAGEYMLEIRYTLKREENYAVQLWINGEAAMPIDLWPTGGRELWAWDRIRVTMRKGKNTIRISPGTQALIDHINVL